MQYHASAVLTEVSFDADKEQERIERKAKRASTDASMSGGSKGGQVSRGREEDGTGITDISPQAILRRLQLLKATADVADAADAGAIGTADSPMVVLSSKEVTHRAAIKATMYRGLSQQQRQAVRIARRVASGEGGGGAGSTCGPDGDESELLSMVSSLCVDGKFPRPLQTGASTCAGAGAGAGAGSRANRWKQQRSSLTGPSILTAADVSKAGGSKAKVAYRPRAAGAEAAGSDTGPDAGIAASIPQGNAGGGAYACAMANGSAMGIVVPPPARVDVGIYVSPRNLAPTSPSSRTSSITSVGSLASIASAAAAAAAAGGGGGGEGWEGGNPSQMPLPCPRQRSLAGDKSTPRRDTQVEGTSPSRSSLLLPPSVVDTRAADSRTAPLRLSETSPGTPPPRLPPSGDAQSVADSVASASPSARPMVSGRRSSVTLVAQLCDEDY
jgi:hypothetical protein